MENKPTTMNAVVTGINETKMAQNQIVDQVNATTSFDPNQRGYLRELISTTVAAVEDEPETREHVIRYVVTHINKDGMRTLTSPCQGRYTHGTADEAQKLLEAMIANNRMLDGKIGGVYGTPLEVRPVPCHPGHFDPMRVWFSNGASTDESQDDQRSQAPRG